MHEYWLTACQEKCGIFFFFFFFFFSPENRVRHFMQIAWNVQFCFGVGGGVGGGGGKKHMTNLPLLN